MEQVQEPKESFLHRYAWPTLRRWPIVVAIVVIAVGATAVWSVARAKPTWTATAAVTSQSQNRAPDQDAVLALGYANYFNQPTYQEQLRAKAKIPAGVVLAAVPGASSPIFYINATADAPDLATSSAASAADTFRSDIRDALVAERTRETQELQKQVDDLVAQVQQPGTTPAAGNVIFDQIRSLQGRITDLSSDATNALKQLQPTPGLAENRAGIVTDLVAGGLAGLVLGLLVAFVLGAVDDRVRRARDVERLGLPVLVDLPAGTRSGAERTGALERIGNAFGSELPRPGHPGARGVVVAVVAPHRTAAVTRFTAELAGLFRYRRGGTLLVRTDLRAGAVPGHDEGAGVVDVLAGTSPLARLVGTDSDGVPVLLQGDPDGRTPYDVYVPERISGLLRQATQAARTVFLDLAPLDEAPESQLLCEAADEVLLVVERGTTKRAQIERAQALLADVHVSKIRVVIDERTKTLPAPVALAPTEPGADTVVHPVVPAGEQTVATPVVTPSTPTVAQPIVPAVDLLKDDATRPVRTVRKVGSNNGSTKS